MRWEIFSASLIPLLANCGGKTIKSVTINDTYGLSDSVELNEMDLLIKFNDIGLFDTTFVFTQYVGFCGFGEDFSKSFMQPRFSNTSYNNNDSTGFGYEPTNDSLLYLNFYWQTIDSGDLQDRSHQSELKRENLSRIATKRNPFSFSFFYATKYEGLELGFLGAESEIENGEQPAFTKLEVFALLDTVKITGYFHYSGYGTYNYLNDFCKIAKTIKLEKSANQAVNCSNQRFFNLLPKNRLIDVIPVCID